MIQEIKTDKFEGLLVKVPDGSYGFRISYGSYVVLSWKHKTQGSGAYRITDNTSEKWHIIGNPFELTDELLAILPETYTGRRYSQWMDILKSLLVYKENPYQYPIIHDFSSEKKYKEQHLKWQQTEERTGNWVLLQKL